MTKRRVRITVLYDKTVKRWMVQVGVLKEADRRLKVLATRAAREAARRIERTGGLAQIVVFKRNGKIQTEWTYGDDPERHEG